MIYKWVLDILYFFFEGIYFYDKWILMMLKILNDVKIHTNACLLLVENC